MNSNEHHIGFDLLARYFAGECSEPEVRSVEEWRNASEENRREFDLCASLMSEMDDDQQLRIDVDAAWEAVNRKIPSEAIVRTLEPAGRSSAAAWGAIAASIATLVVVASVLFVVNRPAEMLSFTTQDEEKMLELEDGSRVWLGAHSSLSYPAAFEENERSVTFDGVAYFEVSASPERPFLIDTRSGDVRVVGTAFEVNTTTKDADLKVTVSHGTVEVRAEDDQAMARVTAGESCAVSGSKVLVSETTEAAPFFWRDRTIRFKRTQLQTVKLTLEELFGIAIELQTNEGSATNLEQCELSATFENEDADTILEIIAATLGLDLEHTTETYILRGSCH